MTRRNVISGSGGSSAIPALSPITHHISLADHRTLVESFPHVVWMTEAGGANIYCNQHWYDYTGLTAAQTVGSGWLAAVHPEDVKPAYAIWQNAVATGVSYTSETRIRRARDGEYRWHQTSALPMRDATGHVVNWIGTAVDIHDSKIAVNQLAEKEARLRAILDTEPECIKLMSADCVLLEINPAGRTMLEATSPEEVVGKSVLGLVDPPYRSALRDLTRQVFQGKTGELDFALTTLKGSHLWMQVYAAPLRDKHGDIQAMLAVSRDITQRKRAEDELRASEARFRALIEHSRDAIALFDAQGKILFSSTSTERILHFRTDEIVDRPFSDFVHPDDLAAAQNGLGQAVGHPGESFSLSARILSKDGSYRVLQGVLTSLLHDPDVRAVVNNFHDITDELQAEEALLRSEERFAKAFRSSPLAITISTLAEGRYLDVNDAFLRMLGYEKEEVVGQTVEALKVWVDPQERAALIQHMHESGRVTDVQTSFRARSGEIRQTEVSAELIELAGVPCMLAITHDVTEAKRLEEQFLQAQKMEAVGLLAGGIAHDFNNMLGVIIGYSEVCLEIVGPDAPSRRHIEQMKTAAHRAANLTRQLLAFSRQQVFQTQILDLNAVVHNLRKMLLRMVGEDVSIVFEPGTPLGSVKADLGQIEQVLMNLVVNARDAMPRGGEIRIATTNTQLGEAEARTRDCSVPAEAYVMLSVGDNGSGMDAQTRARIFEPFFTTKGPTEGTGLGLSTVYGIIKQSEGFITVDSELGKGATFKIYFPRVDAAAEAIAQSKPDRISIRGSETILVVEDDEPVRKLTVTLLENNGYKVLEAGSALLAIKLAQDYKPRIDLLLTDVIMPTMGGGEVAAQLRALRPDIKLLYVSGYTGSLVSRQGVLEGDAAFLSKPFNKSSLLNKIRSVLDG